MITLDETPRLKQNGTYEFSFTGMSSDTKPTGSYNNMKIANGSSFMEINTHEVLFYDEEGETWH